MLSTAIVVMTLMAADLGWLAGCWEQTHGSRRVTEHWTTPDGGTLLGVGRTVEGGKTVEYEFLLIREGKKGLEYVAKPSGQAEAVFPLARSSTQEAVFENPEHDFPTRISYRRQGGALTARIEGSLGGKPRAFDFNYRAVSCPASAR
jgi:hypothetical protein